MSAAGRWRWDELEDGEAERCRQERDLALRHTLVEAELMLASEAVLVGRTLRRAGIDFDPLTFVALRVLEASMDGGVDPVGTLSWLLADGTVERSVAAAAEQLREPDGR